MKPTLLTVLASLLVALLASLFASGAAFQPAPAPADTVSEISAKPWLYEVVRYAYRWQIDERDIDAVEKAGDIVCWVREIKPKLDAGDTSRFGEVVLPQFKLQIRVKRADYTIPELDVKVQTDRFKIVAVTGYEGDSKLPAGFVEVKLNFVETREYLFKTRGEALFPDGALMDRMRTAVREEITKETQDRKTPLPQGVQTCYVAPLSPVSNETWVFWETGRMLIRFASDIDLANPKVWEHEKLAVRTIALDKNVVVSLGEVAGSNAFMTRNQAGRALFNCVILGKKVELQPGVPAAQPK